MNHLPVDAILPDVRRHLREGNALVIRASPGAGKTTRVPPALLGEPWLQGRKLLMLEPRRLAARSAARFMAAQLGEEVGDTVGYRVRLETRVSAATRIEIVTEGVLTRLIQHDPALEGYGAILFDEFHERSLQTDLALALCLEAQAGLRPDLRLIVMSATLEATPVAKLLGNAPVLTSEGRQYPVDVQYRPAPVHGRFDDHVVRIVRSVLEEERGNLLVFLPGTGEIRRVASRLETNVPPDVAIAPLYGDLDNTAQDRAIAPAPAGRRKVVLATSIAETSLTIEGIRVVVDGGRMRVPSFDPVSGMTRLETVQVSRASSDQRCGRAGRLEPGACYRLWSESGQDRLVAANAPEMLTSDLAELVLQLAGWGTRDPASVKWLDPPPAAAWSQARELLQELEALDDEGRITAHGRAMLDLPLHPRLAHMTLKGRALGWGRLACEVAVLLSERDPLRGAPHGRTADIEARLRLLRTDSAGHLRRLVHDLQRALRLNAGEASGGETGVLMAFAYPDRIARRRTGDAPRYLLANGRGACLDEGDPLSTGVWLAVAQLDGQAREARIFLAAHLDEADVRRHFAGQLVTHESVEWDETTDSVAARRQLRLGEIVLEETATRDATPDQIARAFLEAIARKGIGCLPWTPGLRNLQSRILFLRRALGEAWPDVSDTALAANLGHWLLPWLAGMSRLTHLARLPLDECLLSFLDARQRRELPELAPDHITVPSGSNLRVDYTEGEIPVLRVRLQEMFGLKDTPRLAGRRVPVLLHLLSPAQRPVQVTQDLAGFWARAYPEVKKELKGRYPKHYWPDDPLQAVATRRTRPR